jgi:hypothetical protein
MALLAQQREQAAVRQFPQFFLQTCDDTSELSFNMVEK